MCVSCHDVVRKRYYNKDVYDSGLNVFKTFHLTVMHFGVHILDTIQSANVGFKLKQNEWAI